MKNYWWLCADPNEWSFSRINVGETQGFSNKTKKDRKRAYFNAVEVGDLVVGYEAMPKKCVVALLQVSGKDDNHLYFRKLENVDNHVSYSTLLRCPELAEMSYFGCHSRTLSPLKKEEYDFIVSQTRRKTGDEHAYGKKQFLGEVYMDDSRFDALAGVLAYKKNIILQGAPGVGKTYAARRLAYALMGEKDESRIEFVQFHQNYAYEDFVEGYRPLGEGFELQPGIFRLFCEEAAQKPDKDFFFIIDEINRGNMSRIFGDLLTLIEKDYRGAEAKLPYSREGFTVPENLHLIGMMNTADRSLAMIDYALRRRFSFVDMEPAFGVSSFAAYQKSLENAAFDKLVAKVVALNADIARDTSLGKGFCLGHSYFCGLTKETATAERLRAIVEFDLLPMLREYWFDEEAKVAGWEKELRATLS